MAEAFPSGRAALLGCLAVLGIEPQDVVAIPECVTDCVANAVRRVARPMPLRLALDEPRHRLRAAIVYEQWGWPLPAAAVANLRQRLAGVPLILDRVDSADFFSAHRGFGSFDVVSLSKTLGLVAGGFARQHPDGACLDFKPDARFTTPSSRVSVVLHPAVRERFKQSQIVHPVALAWLQDNCPIEAAEAERAARNRTARAVLDSHLSAAWPAWMVAALDSGTGPVWAPILRGSDPATHWRAIARLAHTLGIAAAVRPFNWSGNPLAPRFEPCVALPIHSSVDPSVVSELA